MINSQSKAKATHAIYEPQSYKTLAEIASDILKLLATKNGVLVTTKIYHKKSIIKKIRDLSPSPLHVTSLPDKILITKK